MSNTTSFILGILSSIISVPILYLLRYNLNFIVSIFFNKIYPNISGKYRLYPYSSILVRGDGKTKQKANSSKSKKIDTDLSDTELLQWLKKSRKKRPHHMMKFKQFANRVVGELYLIKDDEIQHIEKINGKITPSRILILNSETIDGKHHNFGTYLLNLKNDLNMIKGTSSGLCLECGDATSRYIFLEKK